AGRAGTARAASMPTPAATTSTAAAIRRGQGRGGGAMGAPLPRPVAAPPQPGRRPLERDECHLTSYLASVRPGAVVRLRSMSDRPASAEHLEGVSSSPEVSLEELQLSHRNHGMHLEGLRYDVTPAGMHYLLIHFDVPEADEGSWRLAVDGLVRNPIELSMADLRSRPSVTIPVTMECAGNGRA